MKENKHVECFVDSARRFEKIIWVSVRVRFSFYSNIFICTKNVRRCRHIDAHKTQYIDALREAVAIKSVSAWPDHRPEISKMVKWTAAKLEKLGTQIELADLGNQTLPCGRVIPLPEVLLGTLGNVSVYEFIA